MRQKIFVVSAQALQAEPLYGKKVMTLMARAALAGGADWIRTSQKHNIKSMVKDPSITVPIIGLLKVTYQNSPIHITPSLKELQWLIKSGVDIIAIDATKRQRPCETLQELKTFFDNHKQAHQKIMADCATVSEMVNAHRLGFDFIGTTMAGYTEYAPHQTPHRDFAILKKAITKLPSNKIVAEGGISTPAQVQKIYQLGINIVVVGGAITRPQQITASFVQAKTETRSNATSQKMKK